MCTLLFTNVFYRLGMTFLNLKKNDDGELQVVSKIANIISRKIVSETGLMSEKELNVVLDYLEKSNQAHNK